MNEEIEIQVIVKNPEEAERKLRDSARFISAKDQKDEYFVPQHKDFFEKDPPQEYLRVRYQDGKNEIGYHYLHFGEDNEKSKTDEYETEIKDPEMMSIILKKLDMKHVLTVTKHRKTFDYKDFEIVIDIIEELGTFMEIEAKKMFGTPADTIKKCKEVLDELDIEWELPKTKGYPVMIWKSKKILK